MDIILATMGGYEQGWSRHNDEGIHRDYQKEAERLAESAEALGLDTVIYDNDFILTLPYYEEHKDVLDKTSFGFAYKAICLYETMRIMEDGDVVLWADSNHIVAKDPAVFVTIAQEHGVFARDHIWVEYPQKMWCKRDTFVNMGCDEPLYHNATHLQDSVLGLCKNDISMRFVTEWKDCSLNYNIMFGNNQYPNFPEFKEHRHNQAIYSMLVAKYKLPFLNRTNNVELEYIIPELDTITPEKPIDNSYRMEADRKDIR